MIGLLLIYFIGKAFYQLAHDYDKSRWGFAILGILSYYAGTFIGGVILGLIGALTESNFVETQPSLVLSLICVPFGLLICWIFYKILVSQWNKKATLSNNDSLDSNLVQ
jgi:branched-subunit amino acid ABC-type transport system permease component